MPRLILVIEDDQAVAELERDILTEAGYTVLTGLGEDALRTAQHEHPDLVLLDLMMGGMDGWTIREGLLRHPATRDIPVIVITALPADQQDMANMRAITAMRKPFNINALTKAVRAAIGPPEAAKE